MHLRNQQGQMTLEMVLLVIALVGGGLLVGNYMREKKFMQAFTQGPWSMIQGMTQAGVWAPAPQAKANHPNRFRRVGTSQGDGPDQ